MPSREDVIRIARTYVNTPYRHQGRRKGEGIDCVGLLFGVAAELGRPQPDFVGYSRWPDGHTLVREMDKRLIRIPVESARPGDVIVFWIRNEKRPQHVGILTDRGVIHTHQKVGRVVETSLNDAWSGRVTLAYEFIGVDDG